MTIAASDFRTCVIKPALSALEAVGIPHTEVAENLLMVTAAVESNLGTYLVQRGGPALGVFQLEPTSMVNLLSKVTLAQRGVINKFKSPQSFSAQLPTNLLLAAVLCRLFYWQIPTPLPEPIFGTFSVDPETGVITNTGYWGYYKRWYNTVLGAATEGMFATAVDLYTDIILS